MNRATFSIQLNALTENSVAVVAWHLLLPAGEINCRDGRGPYRNDDPSIVLTAFADWGMSVDVDYHHQSLEASDRVGLVPSAGSVVELEARNGEIWGRFEWTEAAQAAIASKEVKYLSPVFDYDERTMVVTQLVSVGLTNLPNLYLNALSENSLGGVMDDLIRSLCYMLNLPTTSTPDEIKVHLQRLMDSLGGSGPAAEESMKKAACSLGLGESAKWIEIANKAHAQMQPGQMVHISEFQRVSHELSVLKETVRNGEIEGEINKAKHSGKLAPSMEDWGRNYAKHDLEGFKQWVATSPPVIKPGEVMDDQSHSASHSSIPPNVQNPERWELHGKAKAHQAAHGGSFVDAVKAVQAK